MKRGGYQILKMNPRMMFIFVQRLAYSLLQTLIPTCPAIGFYDVINTCAFTTKSRHLVSCTKVEEKLNFGYKLNQKPILIGNFLLKYVTE